MQDKKGAVNEGRNGIGSYHKNVWNTITWIDYVLNVLLGRGAYYKIVRIKELEAYREAGGFWEGSYLNKGLTVDVFPKWPLNVFTCFIGLETFGNFFTLLWRTILSLDFHSIHSVRCKSSNVDLISSRDIPVFCVAEVYNDLCYITGVLSWCLYTPRHTCRVIRWWNVNIEYRSWLLN